MTRIVQSVHQLGGRMGAYRKWSHVVDRTAATAALRAGFDARFERQVDAALPAHVRERMIAALRSAYFAELVLKRRGRSAPRAGQRLVP